MPKRKGKPADLPNDSQLRIIGGKLRGSKLRYHGEPGTRPMKDRVREAIFNLISTEVAQKQVLDLFAGTGALGLEALSRGASHATFIEKHVPTSRVIAENIAALAVEDKTTLLTTSAFLWAKRDLETREDHSIEGDNTSVALSSPWLVFCSPPYAFYLDHQAEMIDLIDRILRRAPAGSIVVVEADDRFDFHLLPGDLAESRRDEGWDVRGYPPAVVGVWRT